MIVVSDTSPISNLFIIGKLKLLKDVYEEVVIPETVYIELMALRKSGFNVSIIHQASWIIIQAPKSITGLSTLLQKLDLGEAEAILLAKELNADLLLIDESKGRKIAKEEGLKTIRLLGVLLEAKSKGIILSIKEIIDELKTKAKFRIREDLYTQILQLANEE